MTTYGGFDPGTFQPWALNITQNALGTAGVARGLVVAPATPASMNVVVGVDALQGDGICFLSNGGWLRIDAAASLSVPANSSGSNRVDAVVAFVDPTGVGGAPALQYQTSWATGFKGGTSNQLVLALVTVPNGAVSIVASNIVNTPLQASVGAASPNLLDSVVSDNTPGAQQTRVFAQYNAVVAPSATNGQTSFAVPLTGRQRLVAMGRIGGGDELGYFAGPGGWYVPRLFGSASGPLPVKSVDYVGGNLVAASGAQAGEQVVASFKYYDFDRDLMVWSGTTLLSRNSPYLVYQGDVHAGTTHLFSDVWDGTLNSFAPVTPGMAIVVTAFGRYFLPHFAAWQVGQQYSTSVDGGAPSTATLPYSSDVGVVGTGLLLNANPGASADGIHQVTLAYVTGLFDFAGVDVMCNLPGIYVDGGQAVVDGFAVNIGNASIQLTPPNQGYASIVYVDRYGNVTASSRVQAFPIGEALGLRIPLAQAVQYVRPTGTTALYGTYAGVGTPKGLPAVVTLGNFNGGNDIFPSTAVPTGWKLAADPYSPTGGVWQTSSSQDGLVVAAPMTGLDLVYSCTASASFNVNVSNITSFTVGVPPTGSGGTRARLVCATALPVSLYTVRVYNTTLFGGAWAPEFAEVRYPELPTPPPQTLPLAGALSDGSGVLGNYGTMSIMKDVLHDAQFSGGAGTFQLVNDLAHQTPGPEVSVANTSTNQSWAQVVHTSGAFRIHYNSFPGGGIFNVVVDGISTYGTVDTWSGAWNAYQPLAVSPVYYMPGGNQNQPRTVACVATGTKNASSTGLSYIIQGIEYVPPANLVLDAARFGPDGLRPSVRGSAVLGQKGDQLLDQGPGIGTLHLQDRAVSSRKFTPSWQQTVTTAAFSNFGASGNFDPNLDTTIVVEVPSVLWITANLPFRTPNVNGANVQGCFYVDGVPVNLAGASSSWALAENQGTTSLTQSVCASEMVPVGPGQHTIRVFAMGYGNTGVPPYFDGVISRSLSVLAFAL